MFAVVAMANCSSIALTLITEIASAVRIDIDVVGAKAFMV